MNTPDQPKTLGQRLRKARGQLTVGDVARRIGCDESYIRALESDQVTRIRMDILWRMTRFFPELDYIELAKLTGALLPRLKGEIKPHE